MRNFFDIMVKPLERMFKNANKVNTNLAEKIQPMYTISTKYGLIHIVCPNRLLLWRAQTFFEKEPETLSWIDSFSQSDILIDVGANIGLYTLYAATKGHSVYAFEPESQNYALLNQNIYNNNQSARVAAFNVAISDKNHFDYLFLSRFSGGAALHNFGDNTDFNDEQFDFSYKQAAIAYRLDSVLEQLSVKSNHFHLKIDVDGLEEKVIDGASQLLQNPSLKSILIELNINLERDLKIKERLLSMGFISKGQFQPDKIDNPKHRGMFNFIFTRD